MKSTLIVLFFLIPLWIHSQVIDTLNAKGLSSDTTKTALTKNRNSSNADRKSNKIVKPKETLPEFPGGMEELRRFINKNITRPKDLDGKYIQGKVLVRFTVDTLGLVKNPTIVMSSHPFIRDEAIRVIKSLPKWKPGTSDGKPLNVEMVIPITF